MQRLDEAYSRTPTDRDPRRVLGGAALGAAGALAVLVGILLVAVAGESYAARRYAGLCAGLGIPAMLLAVVLVLPASTRARLGVVAGSALTLVGVWLFWTAYPTQWTGPGGMAFETTAVYALGGGVALSFVFSALATFRRRNSPAGTVTLEVTRDGGTETVEVSRREYRRVREAVGDGGESEVIEDLLEE
ncbi:MAG: hypothetical protein V5A30_10595 [Haloarculaceae archaeon]